jgi:protein SCO1/2
MPRSLVVLLSVIAVILIAGAGLFVVAAPNVVPDSVRFWKDDEYVYNGGFYDPPREAHELINAVDQNGDPFTFSQFEGKVILVYFGYINCPDACPATLAEWREVKAELGEDADDVVFVMVTVDPERDTTDRLKGWLEFWDPAFYGVRMSPEDTETFTQQWGLSVTKEESTSASGYLVTHDVSTYVIGSDGQLHLTYPLGFDPFDMADDIRHVRNVEE